MRSIVHFILYWREFYFTETFNFFEIIDQTFYPTFCKSFIKRTLYDRWNLSNTRKIANTLELRLFLNIWWTFIEFSFKRKMQFNAINLLNIVISFDRIFCFSICVCVFHIFKQKVIKEIKNWNFINICYIIYIICKILND